MKKIVLLLSIVFCVSMASQAQKFGVKAGMNYTNLDYKDVKTEYRPAYNFGITFDYDLDENFSLATALIYSDKGCKIADWVEDGIKEEGGKYFLNYLEMPLDVVYNVKLNNLKLFVECGPYAAYAMSGKFKWSGTGEDEGGSEKIKFGSGDDELKSWDFGLNFGLGVKLNSFKISANYDLGLTNLSRYEDKDYKESVKNRVLSLSLTYYLWK